ncbi:MAG TPA: hypothetical protein VIW67_18550, partial [Terriglobales bacterium]
MRIRITILLIAVLSLALPVVAAYIQWALLGLPALPPTPEVFVKTMVPQGFPSWIRFTHYINFFFIILLIRSGLQIFVDHPRLYWNVHCTPGT